MKSFSRPVVVCLLALFAGGCIKSEVLVKVGKDGKGQVVWSTVVPRESVEMMNIRQMETRWYQSSRRGSKDKVEVERDPFFDEKEMKSFAKKLGPGVQFVKASKIDYAGARGAVAVYSFDNINNLMIDLGQMVPNFERRASGQEGGETGDEDNADAVVEKTDKAIEFKLEKGATPKLQVTLPEMESDDSSGADPDEDDDANADKTGEDEEDEQGVGYYDALTMDSYLPASRSRYSSGWSGALMGIGDRGYAPDRAIKGMKMTIAVEVDGEIVATTAKNPDEKKKKICLIDIDMDKAMASDKGRKAGNRLGLGSPERLIGSLMNKVPGLFAETNRLVSIEYK